MTAPSDTSFLLGILNMELRDFFVELYRIETEIDRAVAKFNKLDLSVIMVALGDRYLHYLSIQEYDKLHQLKPYHTTSGKDRENADKLLKDCVHYVNDRFMRVAVDIMGELQKFISEVEHDATLAENKETTK